MADRYCAACSHHGTSVHDADCPERVQLPSPEDWQAIVTAVDKFDRWRDLPRLDAVGRAAIAAVRNMREAPDAK